MWRARPCLRSLRIRVKNVLDLLAAGATREEILEDYPLLEAGDITAALEYAARARAIIPYCASPDAVHCRCTASSGARASRLSVAYVASVALSAPSSRIPGLLKPLSQALDETARRNDAFRIEPFRQSIDPWDL
jgi:Protein of unknown function (DUF433)